MMDDTIGVMKRLISMWRGIGVCAALVAGGAFAEGETLAPVNPFNGTQRREEVYEFTEKPAVEKDGEKWIITFASKGNCDATVAILNGKGIIIRHLASGVLGANAPYPFQQNSRAQKIEWDGTGDMGSAVLPDVLKSCKVRVSLGLKATFERNIGWEPCAPFPGYSDRGKKKKEPTGYMVAKGKDGELYVLSYWNNTGGTYQGRVYKEGKYVRSFWPPPAKDLEKIEKMGYRMVKTNWGDKVPRATRYGMATVIPPNTGNLNTLKKLSLEDLTREIFEMIGVTGAQRVDSWPAELSAESVYRKYFNRKMHRMAVDRIRDELYISAPEAFPLTRIDGKTGEMDTTWFPDRNFDKVSESCFGPKGYLYVGVGTIGYNQFVIRMNRDGQVIPFTGSGGAPLPITRWEGGGLFGSREGSKLGMRLCPGALKKKGAKISALWTGGVGHSNVHERGLYVSPRGNIVAGIQFPDTEHGIKYGIPKYFLKDNKRGGKNVRGTFVGVWDRDGNILTANAVGETQNGHGVTMDRDGNIYAAFGRCRLASHKGLVGMPDGIFGWGGDGSIMKFRGGIPFPRAMVYRRKSKYWRGPEASEDAVKIARVKSGITGITSVDGSLQWAYPGIVGQTTGPCTCHNLRYDMDYFARHWLPANYLYSIMVIDANANIIARLGRYGNVDDSNTDIKEGRDGLRFVWPRAVSVSDSALYVSDHNARRILKAALAYQTEETIPLQ